MIFNRGLPMADNINNLHPPTAELTDKTEEREKETRFSPQGVNSLIGSQPPEPSFSSVAADVSGGYQ